MTRRIRDDAGGALVMALVMGASLVIVLTAVFSRGLSQASNAAGDRCWEAALDNAESALNWGLAQIDADVSFHSGGDGFAEVIGTAGERSAVLAAADSAPEVLTFGTGEGVFLRAPGATVVHAVGYCSGRDEPGRTARVIRVALGADPGGETIDLDYAFLSGSDLQVSGNPTFQGPSASVHANGVAQVSGNSTFHGGCLTASGGGTVSGNLTMHSVCPTPSERFLQPLVAIPTTTARDLWVLSEYDLCPNGAVRAGPSHPTHGASVGDVPCTGHVLRGNASSNAYRNWKRSGDKWDYSGDSVSNGAYYVFQSSVVVGGSPGSTNQPWRVLIVAEGKDQCPATAGGDIQLSGNPVLAPYWGDLDESDASYALVADRDIVWSGSGRITNPAIVFAREQIQVSGTPTVTGAFIARSDCHTPGSPVSVSRINGNPTVRLDGPLRVGDGGGPGPIASVHEWTEVR